MAVFILLNKSSNTIEYQYDYHRQRSLDAPWNDENIYVHFEVPEGKDPRAYSWDGTQVVENESFTPPQSSAKWPKLRRFYKDINPSMDQMCRDDLGYLGLQKESPTYIRGRIEVTNWFDPNEEDIVVIEEFNDVLDENTNELKQIVSTLKYLAEDGSIAFTKTYVKENFNKFSCQTENRRRRDRQIDYLLASAAGTAAEPILDAIFNHYYDEQLKYKQKGGTEFATAINNETDATILGYLDIEVPRNDDPNLNITIRNAILYQIGAIELYEI